MKCPKCGYNSFEHLSACKKCSADLTAYKESLGIRPTVLPTFLQPATPAPQSPAATVAPSEVTDDLFSWDIAEDAATGAEPMPFEPVAAAEAAPATDGDDFAFSFDDLQGVSAAPKAPLPGGGNAGTEAPAPWETPAKTGGDVTSFAGMLESIEREAPAPEMPDEFSFDGLEGFEKVDIFAEGAEQKEKRVEPAPSDPDDFDALFSDEEKSAS